LVPCQPQPCVYLSMPPQTVPSRSGDYDDDDGPHAHNAASCVNGQRTQTNAPPWQIGRVWCSLMMGTQNGSETVPPKGFTARIVVVGKIPASCAARCRVRNVPK
jgi:hypothetical protein